MKEFLNIRLFFFMAFIFLSLVSAIGSKEAAIYPVLLSLDLSLIRDYFINHNDYFRLPDTLLRIVVCPEVIDTPGSVDENIFELWSSHPLVVPIPLLPSIL